GRGWRAAGGSWARAARRLLERDPRRRQSLGLDAAGEALGKGVRVPRLNSNLVGLPLVVRLFAVDDLGVAIEPAHIGALAVRDAHPIGTAAGRKRFLDFEL